MVFYFVQRGETLYAIARRYQTTVHAIVAANRLEDPNAICPGQALIIPRPGEVPSPPPGGIVHLVRAGETIFHLATKFGTSAVDILKANQIAHPEFILPGQQLVVPEPMELGEDWPMVGRGPGRAGTSPVAIQGTPLPGWSYRPKRHLGAQASAPIIRYERIYAALGDGYVYSLDRKSGRVKWRHALGGQRAINEIGDRPLAAPAVWEGLVYICGPNGTIWGIDAYTGRELWKAKAGGPLTSSPAVWGGVVYHGCLDGHLYGWEAKTGALAWKTDLGAPVFHPVAIGDDRVYAVTEKGRLWAVDAQTGVQVWETETEPLRPPIFAEVVVLAGSGAHDPTDGQVLWHAKVDPGVPVAQLDQVIYAGRAVDLFTGTMRWQGGPADNTKIRAHIAAANMMLGVGDDQRLHAWSSRDGACLWTIDLEALSVQPPAVSPGQIAVTLEDGSLHTFRMKSI